MPCFIIMKKAETQTTNWRFTTHNGTPVRGEFPRHVVERPSFDLSMWGDGSEHKADYVIVNNVTAEVAQDIAQTFSSRAAGTTWIVAEVQAAFISQPSPPIKMLYTDKGVLPA